MAKTEFLFIKGKTKWFRHTTPDPWGNWKHQLWPDNDGLELVRLLQTQGLKNVLKKDEDGWFTTFRRPQQKMMRGKVVGFAPPEVLDAQGNPLRDILVGNGSDVTTKLAVYEHGTPGGGKAKAARWEASRVDNLVPFEKDRDFEPDQEKQIRNLEDQPAPLF
jgi:hypothetical protein